MKRTVWCAVVLFCFMVFCGSFARAEELSKKDHCVRSSEIALELFKAENKLFLSMSCASRLSCMGEDFSSLSHKVDVLYERTVAEMHLCLYGNNPKLESAVE